MVKDLILRFEFIFNAHKIAFRSIIMLYMFDQYTIYTKYTKFNIYLNFAALHFICHLVNIQK